MNIPKNRIALIIILSILLGWIFNIFPGRLIVAKISTWPLLNRWKILSPQAPIVITNRETVRVSDGSDITQAAASVKSKISLLVKTSGSEATVIGSSINLTSDGSFVTVSNAQTTGDYLVLLSDGRTAGAEQKVIDAGTGLLFFKAQLNNVPTAALANSKDLALGDKIIFVKNSLQSYLSEISPAAVKAAQSQVAGRVFKSDYPRRAFFVTNEPSTLTAGEILINASGEVEGVWNGDEIISSDVLKNSMSLYFAHQQRAFVLRPQFGFNYQIITQTESKLVNLTEGAMVKDVLPSSPAAVAGLLTGDIIIFVDGEAINESSPLEEVLEKYKPQDKIAFTIIRRGENLVLNLTAGASK